MKIRRIVATTLTATTLALAGALTTPNRMPTEPVPDSCMMIGNVAGFGRVCG
jgi:hypothetical protein